MCLVIAGTAVWRTLDHCLPGLIFNPGECRGVVLDAALPDGGGVRDTLPGRCHDDTVVVVCASESSGVVAVAKSLKRWNDGFTQ